MVLYVSDLDRRLGFVLPNPGTTGERVGALRYPVTNRRGMLLTARDPDGNVLELTLAEGHG